MIHYNLIDLIENVGLLAARAVEDGPWLREQRTGAELVVVPSENSEHASQGH